jgi:CheY-like chemotaxis protein
MAKILIVDDDPSIVASLRAALTVQGYQVLTASDGDEGIETAQAESPDLILLDLMMPKLNGDHVCRTLKGDPAYADIPIIMLTAVQEKAGLKFETDETWLPADAYLDKPVQLDVLLPEIQRLLAARTPQ